MLPALCYRDPSVRASVCSPCSTLSLSPRACYPTRLQGTGKNAAKNKKKREKEKKKAAEAGEAAAEAGGEPVGGDAQTLRVLKDVD